MGQNHYENHWRSAGANGANGSMLISWGEPVGNQQYSRAIDMVPKPVPYQAVFW